MTALGLEPQCSPDPTSNQLIVGWIIAALELVSSPGVVQILVLINWLLAGSWNYTGASLILLWSWSQPIISWLSSTQFSSYRTRWAWYPKWGTLTIAFLNSVFSYSALQNYHLPFTFCKSLCFVKLYIFCESRSKNALKHISVRRQGKKKLSFLKKEPVFTTFHLNNCSRDKMARVKYWKFSRSIIFIVKGVVVILSFPREIDVDLVELWQFRFLLKCALC